MEARRAALPRDRSGFLMKLLLAMALVEFVKGALLVAVLPIYASGKLGLSASALGFAFALQYIGDNACRAPVGRMLDRYGYRLPMAAGLAATVLAVALIAAANGPLALLAGCLLLGAGTSPLWPCAAAGATEAAGRDGSGTALSAVYVASFAGTGAGPVAVGWLAGGGSMAGAFPLLLGFAAAALLIALLLPPGAPHRGEEQPAGASGIRGLLSGIADAVRRLRGSRLLVPAMFLQTLALGLLTPVVTLYAREELGLTAGEFSALLLAGGAATLGLLLLAGRLADRLGPRPLLLVGIPAASAATAYFAAVHTRPQLYAAVAAVAFGYALLIPSWNAFVARAIPDDLRGAAWGAALAIEGTGFIVGPIVSGWTWEHVSRRAPFLLSGAALAALFVLYLFISFRKTDMVR